MKIIIKNLFCDSQIKKLIENNHKSVIYIDKENNDKHCIDDQIKNRDIKEIRILKSYLRKKLVQKEDLENFGNDQLASSFSNQDNRNSLFQSEMMKLNLS